MDLGLFPRTATICSSDHAFVRLTGEDALAFLQDTTTQDLVSGASAVTCLLDGTGHVLAVFRVLPLGEDLLLDGPPASRAALTGWLAAVGPLSGCEIVDESDRWGLTMIRGAGAEATFGTAPPQDFEQREDGIVVRVDTPIPGFDVLTRSAVPAQTMAPDEWDRWRVRAGIPVYGVDVTARHIVNETPFLTAVSPDKGCYPGQETVAKIRNLGRARRAVVGFRFDEQAPPAGTSVTVQDEQVGTITSAGFDAAIGTVRSEVEPGARIHAGGLGATVTAL